MGLVRGLGLCDLGLQALLGGAQPCASRGPVGQLWAMTGSCRQNRTKRPSEQQLCATGSLPAHFFDRP
jgi:hypothetical protein